ncbi:ead/Ea22-like family protein [Salmonella enterica]|uniref:ead/Ea22-like family protein n=1 Tax=Citrobacter freundii TaxID=546 RepID=UPI00333615B2
MTALNKQALLRAAVKIGAHTWEAEGSQVWSISNGTADSLVLEVFGDKTSGQQDCDIASFIAAANSATVLALLDELETAEKRNAELQSENAYIRNRNKELDLLIGKNILVMQAAIIEWQATSDAKNGLAWIYNTLFGPGELPDESEKDAQAYFDRKYAPIDEELMALHKWFWEQSEAERAAAGIGVKGE